MLWCLVIYEVGTVCNNEWYCIETSHLIEKVSNFLLSAFGHCALKLRQQIVTTKSLVGGLLRGPWNLFDAWYHRQQSLAMSWHLASARSNAVQDASARSQGLHALSCVYAMEDVIETEENSLKCPGQHSYILSVFIWNHLFTLLIQTSWKGSNCTHNYYS